MVGHDVRTKFIPKTVIVQMNLKIYLKRNLRINEITLSYIVITKICAISVYKTGDNAPLAEADHSFFFSPKWLLRVDFHCRVTFPCERM